MPSIVRWVLDAYFFSTQVVRELWKVSYYFDLCGILHVQLLRAHIYKQTQNAYTGQFIISSWLSDKRQHKVRPNTRLVLVKQMLQIAYNLLEKITLTIVWGGLFAKL